MKTKKLTIRVYNIEWDTDGDKELFESLPQNITMGIRVPRDWDEDEMDDYIGGKLSDEHGFCHFGYEYDIIAEDGVGKFNVEMSEGKTCCESCPFHVWSNSRQDYDCLHEIPPFECEKYDISTLRFLNK